MEATNNKVDKMSADYERTCKRLDKTKLTLERVQNECARLAELHACTNSTPTSAREPRQYTGAQDIIMSER